MIELRVDGISDHGVAKHSGRERVKVAIPLLANAVGRFVEEEEFVLERGIDSEAHRSCLFDRAPKDGSRTDIRVLALEAPDQEQRILFKGNAAQRREIEPDRGIAITGMPAGHLDPTFVELVVAVPAEYDVAEAETLVHGRSQLLSIDVFPA